MAVEAVAPERETKVEVEAEAREMPRVHVAPPVPVVAPDKVTRIATPPRAAPSEQVETRAVRAAMTPPREPAKPSRMARAAESLRVKTGAFVAAAFDLTKMQARVDAIVAKARANDAIAQPAQATPQMLTPVANSILGLNTGNDAIAEAIGHVRSNPYHRGPHPHLEAFDAAGYHVLTSSIATEKDDKTLTVVVLKASHGRNLEDLSFSPLAKVPGRGNARVISEAFQALVQSALENGFVRLKGTAGFSQDAAKLYGKMGFKPTSGEPRQGVPLYLDLRDPAAVRQMLFVFTAARAGITDVPKNVGQRIVESGETQSDPVRPSFAGELGSDVQTHKPSD